MADKPVIRVGHLKITDHLILGISKMKADQGIEPLNHCQLEAVPHLGWNQVADSLANGSINAAFVLAPTAMDLFKAGVKIKLLLFTHKTGSVIITNKKAGIKTIEDFRGKVVIIPYQLSVHHMLLHQMLKKAGLSPGTGATPGADVLLEVMAPSQMPEAIQYDDEGEVAGFIVAEPYGSQAVSEGYGEEFSLSKDLWPKHPCCVFVATEELINNHPDAVHELTRSLVNSGHSVDQNPEAAAKLGSIFLGQKPEVVKKVLTEPADRITTSELFPVIDDLARMQDYMCDQMEVLKTKIDLNQFVDTRFAKEAKAE
ncbi:ABC transporter substrate-binding protein [Dethiosulfatarculus sandiegensis]|uniref:Twin-arginine translocation pathway signal protein n=1 Tax=Dethiosulfatarculus sandiegensis TaxID=1429043 RepID=A0A0D2JQT0_9BACT|nr:ABC transporter substrate-binding protein [Dethiosulfatarculus sandiegensis]KIX11860.1 twin-arginine translocation pathway signal protein [Dethiosulfatarculus sandiegensis]